MHNRQEPPIDFMEQFLSQVSPILDQFSQTSDPTNQVTQPAKQKMPEMALALSKYFLAMSKYCLTHYHSLVKQQKKSQENRGKMQSEYSGVVSGTSPKQPVTAYILYFRDRVPDFKEKHPKCTYPELTCLISKEWNQLPQSQKEPYVHRASQDRKRYKTEKGQRKARRSKQAERESGEEGSASDGEELEDQGI